MNIIIIGDRFQKRMKSKGCVALIKNQKNTILQDQYQILKKVFPQSKIIYIYGFDGKRLQSFLNKHKELSDIKTLYNKDYELYNTIHSLSLAKDYLDDQCLIIPGDCKLTKKIFNKFDTSGGSQIFIDNDHNNDIGCILYDNSIHNIAYDLDNKLADIYYLTQQHAKLLKTFVENESIKNYFLFEIINKIIDQQHIIKPYFCKR